MTAIRLYIDEDALDADLVRALRSRGIDTTTVTDVNRQGHRDEEQLSYAAQSGLALYSFNEADFCRLHKEWMAKGRSHAGLILCIQQRYSVGEQMRRLLKLMARINAEEMRNRVEFLSAWT